MKLSVLLLLFLTACLYAEKVEIQADKFEANEQKLTSVFTGHVIIQKGKDTIRAKRVTILFDRRKKPKRYTAEGNVRFELHMKDQFYRGEAKRLDYLPEAQRYEAKGDVMIEEVTSGKKLFGEKVTIDRKSGKSEITGKKNRPVKMIFSVEEK